MEAAGLPRSLGHFLAKRVGQFARGHTLDDLNRLMEELRHIHRRKMVPVHFFRHRTITIPTWNQFDRCRLARSNLREFSTIERPSLIASSGSITAMSSYPSARITRMPMNS